MLLYNHALCGSGVRARPERRSRERHCLPSQKKRRKTVYIAAKNSWWLDTFSMTANKLQHISSRTHKVSEKNLAFKLHIWICSLCPSHNCSNWEKVHLQTGISGPSCLVSGGIRLLKDRGDSDLIFISTRESGFRDIPRSPASWRTTLNHLGKLLRAVRGSKRWLAVMSYMVNVWLHTNIFPCTLPWGKGKFSSRKLITATTSGFWKKPAKLREFNW